MRAKSKVHWPWRVRLLRGVLCVAVFFMGIAGIPSRWCGREAGRWYAGDVELQSRLAQGVAQWLTNNLTRGNFSTGSAQFDGEWLFGTYLMAGMGFGQTALEHPEWRAQHVQYMSACVEQILTPRVRAFDRESWDADPIDSLDGDSGHAAYLGYLNLLLSLHRFLDAHSPHAALNDRITAALVRRVQRSPTLLIQTYPQETYPVDNAAVIGSIALHGRATGANHRELIEAWIARCRRDYLDPKTGLLYQCVDSQSGKMRDVPRGSGTCLAAYFLSFADAAFSAELHRTARQHLAASVLGFGIVREYPAGVPGRGDIDSGPVLHGYGVSVTGFFLGGCRIHGDPDFYEKICRTVHLFGAPLDRAGRRQFVSGGPIGDAIMFAMLTAQPARMRSSPRSQTRQRAWAWRPAVKWPLGGGGRPHSL